MQHTRIVALCLLMIVTGGTVLALTSQRAEREPDDEKPKRFEPQEKWEYLVIAGGTTNTTPTGNTTLRKEPRILSMREIYPLEMNLDKLGEKGWELVSVGGPPNEPVFFMKRRK